MNDRHERYLVFTTTNFFAMQKLTRYGENSSLVRP